MMSPKDLSMPSINVATVSYTHLDVYKRQLFIQFDPDFSGSQCYNAVLFIYCQIGYLTTRLVYQYLCLRSVSYTHLEVGLIIACVLFMKRVMETTEISVITDEIDPVSYTHLDVYKRQLYDRISFLLYRHPPKKWEIRAQPNLPNKLSV